MFTIKKKRRIIIIVLILFLIVLFGLITYKYIQARNEEYAGDKALTTAELDLKMITEYYPTKVYVYGDKIAFHSSVDVENISEIRNFAFDDKYKYELIIVNDLHGQTDLSKKEWSILKEKVYNDNRVNFFYLGDRQMEKMADVGIIDSDFSGYKEGDLSVGVLHESNEIIHVNGTYTNKEEEFLLTDSIIHELAFNIRQSNE